MPTTETLLQSPTIDLIDDADLLWVWNSSASALTKATRASVVGDIDLLFSNGSNKQISINDSPAATVGRQLTVSAGDVASGTNLAGGNLDLSAGLGTGTGNSNLIFSTGQSTGSSTSVQVKTERMRIINSGNVGIGTTSPGNSLGVSGAVSIGSSYATQTGTNTSDGLIVQGSVGIGTTSPGAKLEIRSTDILTLRLRRTGYSSNSGIIAFENDNAIQGYLGVVNNGIVGFGASQDLAGGGRTFLALDSSNDRVGIGTTSPSTRLDIDNGALELAEMTAPGAGAANTVRIYAVDNGAGKTQLMAIFNTGAAQQLAIQP